MKGKFGLLPFISGTFWVTFGAMAVAIPPCLLTAIYLSEYARWSTKVCMKPAARFTCRNPLSDLWGLGSNCSGSVGTEHSLTIAEEYF